MTSLPATTVRSRVRQVIRLDLSDIVDVHGELEYREAQARLCRLGTEAQPQQAVVVDLGDASWAAMPSVFRQVAEYLAEAGAVQVQGTHGAFVAEAAAQLEAGLR